MTTDEAIKIGKQYLAEGYIMSTQDFHEFIALGIEALKVIKLNRPDGYIYSGHLLPGETEE